MPGEPNIKEAGNYSREEINTLRETFAADLKQYRVSEGKCAWVVLILFLAGFAVVFCSTVLFQPPAKWLLVAGIVLIGAGLVLIAVTASLLQNNLRCPGCHHRFIDKMDKCCPDCGSPSLEPPNWYGARFCNECQRKLVAGKNRNFRYKACTHCGVFLDDKGL
jgi:RNA polymerase subunit RPABC4/transcription elongation factor Spt4